MRAEEPVSYDDRRLVIFSDIAESKMEFIGVVHPKRVIGPNQFGASVHVMLFDHVVDIFGSSTDSIGGFENRYGISAARQLICRRKTCETGTHNRNGYSVGPELFNRVALRQMFFCNGGLMFFKICFFKTRSDG